VAGFKKTKGMNLETLGSHLTKGNSGERQKARFSCTSPFRTLGSENGREELLGFRTSEH